MLKFKRGAVLAAAVVVFGACDDDPAGPEFAARYKVQVLDEDFVVAVETAAQVQQMEDRLASGDEGVINGNLLSGDGGFNTGWGWRLDPATVHTADVAAEVCDGRPSMVEDDLDYWLNTVGYFCPWAAKVVERIE